MDPRDYQYPYGYHPGYLDVGSSGTDTVYSSSAPAMSRGPSYESSHSATYNEELSPVPSDPMAGGSVDYFATTYDGFGVYDTSLAPKVDGTDASRFWYGNSISVPQTDITMYQQPDWPMPYPSAPPVPGDMTLTFDNNNNNIPSVDPEAETFEASAEANGTYGCQYGGCDAKAFKRKADLERHIRHVHVADENKEKFYCDYPKCQRSDDAFHRIDHCRDHYRDYHLEDLARRRGESDDWYRQRRNVPRSWWRCTRCLQRVRVDESNFDCPSCHVACDRKRQRLRTGH